MKARHMMTLESLGRLVVKKRGEKGIRAAAAEVGVSPATLSRVENGHLPDLENYRKICKWLGIEPESVVGTAVTGAKTDIARVHFKKSGTISPETAEALAQLILAAQRASELRDKG
jgi:transcriptional regulator with XRE-family HTH domain